MTTPPRKTKLYRKKMWMVYCTDGTAPGNYPLIFKSKREAVDYIAYPQDRVVRVEVRELPKAAGRGRKS